MEHSWLSNIPNDIIPIILSKLPRKPLVQFKCVCKEWHSWIQILQDDYLGQPRLAAITFSRDNVTVGSLCYDDLSLENHCRPFGEHPPPFALIKHIDDDDWPSRARVLGSCNGLLLLTELPMSGDLFLWNPMTRSCVKVLELDVLGDGKLYPDHTGLRYDSSVRDSKVVLFLMHVQGRPDPLYGGKTDVVVASLKEKEWRTVPFPYRPTSITCGTVFRNTIHWKVSDVMPDRVRVREEDWRVFLCNSIIYFDMGCDEFKMLPSPEPPKNSTRNEILSLGVIDNCLCLGREVGEEQEILEVMIMKEYGVKKSWVTMFLLPNGSEYRITYYNISFYSSKVNSKVLFWDNKAPIMVCVYNVEKNEMERIINVVEEGDKLFDLCFYVETLASLEGLAWDENKHKRFASFKDKVRTSDQN